MRVFNFAAGPATLPLEVLQQAQSEMTDWKASGMSVMEVSHRSKAFIAVAQEAEADLRELLAIPVNYKVLFLQGGATGMFSAIPMNLATADSTVDYVNTGAWSKKAIGEAKRYCKVVNVSADEAASNYSTVPAQGALKLAPNAAYFHYTPNETIGGVEFDYVPQVGNVPLVADFSSTILSRPIDVSKFPNDPMAAYFAKGQAHGPVAPKPLYDDQGVAYLQHTFEEIDAHWGSVDAYLDKELGIGPREIARLRALYLE